MNEPSENSQVTGIGVLSTIRALPPEERVMPFVEDPSLWEALFAEFDALDRAAFLVGVPTRRDTEARIDAGPIPHDDGLGPR